MTAPAATERLSTLDLLAQRGIFPAREQPRRPKDAYLFLCPLPGHDDTDPSFSVHQDGNSWKCWPCGEGGGSGKLLELLDGPPITPLPKAATPKTKKVKKSSNSRPEGCTLPQLAVARSLPIEHLQAIGWWDASWTEEGVRIPAVAIRYPGGRIKYRVRVEGSDKYRWGKGSGQGLYHIDRLEDIRRNGWVLFVEGETDPASGHLMGLPVVGVPGAGAWKYYWAKHFHGLAVYAWQEPGQGGETFVKHLSKSFPGLRVIDAPGGIKDLCELHDQAGDGALDLFNDLKAEAHVISSPDEMSWEEIVEANRGTGRPENYYRPGISRDELPNVEGTAPVSDERSHTHQGYIDECWPIHARRRKAAAETGKPDRLTGEIKTHLRYLASNSRPSDAEKHYIHPYGVKLCIALENPHLATPDMETLLVALLGETDHNSIERPVVRRSRQCGGSCRWDCPGGHGTKMTGQAECRLHYCPNCLTDLSHALDRARLPDIDPDSGAAYRSVWLVGRYPLPDDLQDWEKNLIALQKTWGDIITKIQRRKGCKGTVLWRSFTAYYDLNEAWIHWKIMFKEDCPGQADFAIEELNTEMGATVYDDRRYIHGELATLQLVENSRTHLLGFSEFVDWPEKYELFAAHYDATKGKHVFQGMGALWTLLREAPKPEPLKCDECGSRLQRVVERPGQPAQEAVLASTGGPDPPENVFRGWRP